MQKYSKQTAIVDKNASEARFYQLSINVDAIFLMQFAKPLILQILLIVNTDSSFDIHRRRRLLGHLSTERAECFPAVASLGHIPTESNIVNNRACTLCRYNPFDLCGSAETFAKLRYIGRRIHIKPGQIISGS